MAFVAGSVSWFGQSNGGHLIMDSEQFGRDDSATQALDHEDRIQRAHRAIECPSAEFGCAASFVTGHAIPTRPEETVRSVARLPVAPGPRSTNTPPSSLARLTPQC